MSQERKVEKVMVLGAGPAGLTAAIYAGRAELNPLVLTGKAPGGQAALTHLIENYPGFPEGIVGAELTRLMQQQAERFGARIVMEEAIQVDLSSRPFRIRTHSEEYLTQTLVIATGVSPRRLGVPGEEEFIGRGVSFCATCDGFFFKGKEVAVIGGGNSALDEGLFLTRFARRVYIVHRRDRLRADPVLQRRARANEKISFVLDTVVTHVLGEKGVTGLALRNVKTGEESTLPVDGVFIYVGNVPNTQLFQGQLELDERGYIVTDRRMHTSVPGVFACGDVQERALPQVATAVGSGAIAAMEAEKYLAELEGRAYPERGTGL